MSGAEVAEFIAPWPSTAPALPRPAEDQLQLACAYDLDVGVDCCNEELQFVRRGDFDELWVDSAAGDARYCAVRRKSLGNAETASVGLFDLLVRARLGYGWPARLRTAGVITQAEFDRVKQRILDEQNAAVRKAQLWRGAEILRVARELSLGPEGSGGKPTSWLARCPETNHTLMINAETGQWGCGWCRKKGGVEEIRKFVVERQERRGQKQVRHD